MSDNTKNILDCLQTKIAVGQRQFGDTSEDELGDEVERLVFDMKFLQL